MERQRLFAALIAGAAYAFILAEPSAGQGPGPGMNDGQRRVRGMRQRWRDMSFEDRQRVRANAQRWLQLPPDERRQLRLREGIRRERIRQDAQTALQNSGLQLEAEKRELYERRYIQERRRIDRALRQEMEERRQRELGPVMENLRKEFTSPAATPAVSASPAK